VFRVLLNARGRRLQAAVVSITRAFDFPPLNGSVNPVDGQLYLAGFQVLGWGTTAKHLAGLGRVRYTGVVSTLPRAVVPMAQGLLLQFDTALDRRQAANPDNYSITSWHYKRTWQYGSPQFKTDGTPGIDRLAPSRAYVSKDGRAVFVAIPGMTPVMQMRAGWSLARPDKVPFQGSAYFTPYELPVFDPAAEGFGTLELDMSPRAVAKADAAAPVTAAEGRRLAQLYGCIACHATDSTTVSMLGPSWKGLYGSQRPYAKGALQVTADDAYLRESILEPSARIVSGYERGEAGMPSYSGVLSTSQIDAIILFIKGLK
jgi:mono/diheme cytochrome c family protein